MNDDNDKRAYYSKLAEKIGNRIRQNLIFKSESPKIKVHRIQELANSLTSFKNHEMDRSQPYPTKLPTYSSHRLRKQKKRVLTQFKQKLKQNMSESRTKKEEKQEQLVNKIRWRKTNNMVEKAHKIEEHQNRKRKQVDMVRDIIYKSKQYLRVVKKQNQLEHAFMCFSRRIKLVEDVNKKK